MIDTDRYEGHTEGPWWINHKDGDGATSIWSGSIDEADMNHVADVDAHDSDLRLIADAPLLLEAYRELQDYHTALLNWVMNHLDRDEDEVKEMIYE